MKNFFKMVLATFVGVIVSFIIIFLFFIGIISAIIAAGNTPVTINSKTILKLSFDKPIVDRSQNSPLSGVNFHGLIKPKEDGLNDILATIKKAKTDIKINGIYLEIDLLQARYATIEEIRNSLLDFKKSGKFIIAYSDYYTLKSYYLSSIADKIYLNPKGGIDFLGMRSEMMFYKGTFEKLGIEMQVFKHGKFKSYPEPYVNDKMSEENRSQISQLLNSVWSHTLEGISTQRQISVVKLNSLADRMVLLNAESCQANKFVDSLFYRDQVNDKLIKLSGQTGKEPVFVGLAKYERVPSTITEEYSKNKIAVIYAQGDIELSGDADDEISGEKMAKTIRDARKDTSIKAIVFRVNSPGGYDLASSIIWREVILAVKEKPLVVSMGDYAASGGYYISCPASYIVTNPNTVTGSIGVFGMLPNANKFLKDKLGITTDVVRTNKNSDFPTIFHAMNQDEKLVLQAQVDRVYDEFVARVSEGRKMDKNKVELIGEGRVWSGEDAIKIGLADTLGGLKDAVKIAARLAKLKNYCLVNLPVLEDPIEKLLKSLSDDTKASFINSELNENIKYLQFIKKVQSLKGIQARMPYELEIY